jgi:hypothetical protein
MYTNGRWVNAVSGTTLICRGKRLTDNNPDKGFFYETKLGGFPGQ